MEWNHIEYIINFYKFKRIVKANWTKKEGRYSVLISECCQTKVLMWKAGKVENIGLFHN